MKKEKLFKKKTLTKKIPEISKNQGSHQNKRGRPKHATIKIVVLSKKKLNQCQKKRLLRKKYSYLVLATYYECRAVSHLILYHKTCEDSQNQDNEVVFKFNIMTARQLIEFLKVNHWTFLSLLHLMIKSNNICISDTLRTNFQQEFLYEQADRSFLFGLSAVRRKQGNLLSQQWLSLSIKQIMTLFIISILLQGVGQIKCFRMQIDYPMESQELEVFTVSIFEEVVGNLLSNTKLLTTKVFDYLKVNYQIITDVVKKQILNLHREQNQQKVPLNVFSPLTKETLMNLGFVEIKQKKEGGNEQVQNGIVQQNFGIKQKRCSSNQIAQKGTIQRKAQINEDDEQEDYYKWLRWQESLCLGQMPSHQQNYNQKQYLQAISFNNEPKNPYEGEIRPISIDKAHDLFLYDRPQDKKRDRSQKTKKRTQLKNQNKNKQILSEHLQMLQKKKQTRQNLTSLEREQMRYLNQFLLNPQINTYEIDQNKINPEVLLKMKFPRTPYHEIKHQNKEIDVLISELIQDENYIVQSIANLIYHGMVAYKIHLRAQE